MQKKTPVIAVCGIQEAAMLTTSMSLHLGLPNSVSVSHSINPETQLLTRTVSDLTGIIEQEHLTLEHTCVWCAVREDVVPTLERLAATQKWDTIVARLPLAAEARQVCRVIAWAPDQAPHVRVSAIITALDGATIAEDVLGSDSLVERGLATGEDDQRGVAEVTSSMVEYADQVCLTGAPSQDELDLLATLAPPGTRILTDPLRLDCAVLAYGIHRHRALEDWVHEVQRGTPPSAAGPGAWRMQLTSDRPFHPERFYQHLPVLGGGPRRSRGCFWLPTRPMEACIWDGAGGQSSIGGLGLWGFDGAVTSISVVGMRGDEEGRKEIEKSFNYCLLTPQEMDTLGPRWRAQHDGLEPWLGPIENVA